MIVLSAGMQKSGTAWYFNLTNDLLIAAGHQDVRAIRSRFCLYPILRHHNCNMGSPNPFKLALITIPHILGNTFVVKSHARPGVGLRLLTSAKIIRTTYIYRDPRDVAISAFEHGQRIRDSGATHTFAKFDSIKTSIAIVGKGFLGVWDAWMAYSQAHPDQVLIARYEDLVADTAGEVKRLAAFLGLDVPAETWRKIIARYQGDKARADGIGLHFNQGIVGRFRSILSSEELDLCKLHFGDYLEKMGYPE
jgi:hypothetical protein